MAASDEYMRPDDKLVFLRAAAIFRSAILVRATNPASLKWIGMNGFIPKPISCKAKTADKDVNLGGKLLQTAGLVVNPELVAGAYKSEEKAGEARTTWEKFKKEVLSTDRTYDVDKEKGSVHYGCVRREKKYIHGDYDLKDIIMVGHTDANVSTMESLEDQPHSRSVLLGPIQAYVNAQIGVPMIQHGGEAQYADHTKDTILCFAPGTKVIDGQLVGAEPYEVLLEGLEEIKEFYRLLKRPVIDLHLPSGERQGLLAKPADDTSQTREQLAHHLRFENYKPLSLQELRAKAKQMLGIS